LLERVIVALGNGVMVTRALTRGSHASLKGLEILFQIQGLESTQKQDRCLKVLEFTKSNCAISATSLNRYYSIPILLLSGALVKSVNNSITVTERVKARSVALYL